jgi:threonine synthase
MSSPTFVTRLYCGMEGDDYPADTVQTVSKAGKPLLVDYDLEGITAAVTRDEMERREWGMWQWREFLPIRHDENVVSLGEIATPLLTIPRTVDNAPVLVKDEGRLPTGSFKARGMAAAISMAKELGLTRLAMPTNGNAGAALAAYGSRAGRETYIFCPDNTPDINVREIELQGGKVWTVNGLIDECGEIVGQGMEPMGWFNVSTLKEPYRIEGKKTMGLELALQLAWDPPDVIFYPTGGGTGLIGMWKAFNELKAIGWIDKLPRMVAVQSTGCAPIVKAWHDGVEHAPRWENAETIASGIRVPAALGDFLILRAVRESGGFAVAVPDDAIEQAQLDAARDDGVLMSPEGAATLAGYRAALAAGDVSATERAVLFNCGNGLKYPMPPVNASIDLNQPIDWDALKG